ncbi:MAG: VTT domain-containing protein [Phycisphaerae bacterium]
MTERNAVSHMAKWVNRAAPVVIILSLIVIARLLPIGQAINLVQGHIAQWGIVGIIAFGLIYVAATVLLIPGSALTALGGVLFGIWKGTLIVSISATVGAAVAFLLGRYIFRRSIERRLSGKPKFAAIDHAVSARGWVIVALLRLSPIVPFNLSNYFFGLTGIGFWRYVLASWICMLPGTLLYVYLGYTASVATGAGHAGGGVLHWVLLGAGLVIVLWVSLYTARLARKALASVPNTGVSAVKTDESKTEPTQTGWSVRTTVLGLLAILSLSLAACSWVNRSALAGLFGPPPVKLTNKFKSNPKGPQFDNSLFTRVLATYVHRGGWVDYAGLAAHPQDLDAYIAELSRAPFSKLGRNNKLALLINAYNAFTMRLILNHYPGIGSIRDIPSNRRWTWVHWNIGGKLYSLDQIELTLRSDFADPRIHFAINCASIGCPELGHKAYEPATVNAQLQQQAIRINNNPRWVHFSKSGRTLYLTQIYSWYSGDFHQAAGSVLKFIARFNKRVAADLAKGNTPNISYMPYSWRLDSIVNRPTTKGN